MYTDLNNVFIQQVVSVRLVVLCFSTLEWGNIILLGVKLQWVMVRCQFFFCSHLAPQWLCMVETPHIYTSIVPSNSGIQMQAEIQLLGIIRGTARLSSCRLFCQPFVYISCPGQVIQGLNEKQNIRKFSSRNYGGTVCWEIKGHLCTEFHCPYKVFFHLSQAA